MKRLNKRYSLNLPKELAEAIKIKASSFEISEQTFIRLILAKAVGVEYHGK